MKRTPHPRTTTERLCTESPEAIDEACITTERATDAATDNDGYWPNRIKQAFSKGGFAVHRLEREAHHPVWVAWLNVGSGDLPADRKLGAKLLRKALADAGLRIRAGELDVVERRRDRVKCVFLFGAVLPELDLIGI